jgi:hypothetical protein
VSILVLALTASATASLDRITRGEAQAVFEASATGGGAILFHASSLNGNPAASPAAAGVRINAFLPWQGRHYCALDWHVIAINLTTGNGPGDTYTRGELAALAASVEVVYALDGATLDIGRTPVRPNPDVVGLSDAFTASHGRVISPEELAVGNHTLGIVISDSTGFIDASSISFTVDPEGEGACV